MSKKQIIIDYDEYLELIEFKEIFNNSTDKTGKDDDNSFSCSIGKQEFDKLLKEIGAFRDNYSVIKFYR